MVKPRLLVSQSSSRKPYTIHYTIILLLLLNVLTMLEALEVWQERTKETCVIDGINAFFIPFKQTPAISTCMFMHWPTLFHFY